MVNDHVKNVIKYIPSKIIPAIGGLIILSLYAKNFTGNDYGEYSLMLGISIMCAQLGFGWIGNAIINNNSSKVRGGIKINKSIFLELVIGIAIVIFVAEMSNVFNVKIIKNFWTVVFLAVLIGLNGVLISILQSVGDIKKQQTSLVLQYVLIIGISTCLINLSELNIKNVYLALLIGWGGANFYMIYGINSNVIYIKNTKAKLIKTQSFWYIGWFAIAQLFLLVDKYAIQSDVGSRELSHYAALKDLFIGASSLIIMPIMFATHPAVSIDVKEGKIIEAFKKINYNNNAFMAVYMFVEFIYITLGDHLIPLFLGNNYNGDKRVGGLIITYIFITAVYMNNQKILEVNNNIKSLFLMYSLSLCVVFSVIYFNVENMTALIIVKALILGGGVYSILVNLLLKKLYSSQYRKYINNIIMVFACIAYAYLS